MARSLLAGLGLIALSATAQASDERDLLSLASYTPAGEFTLQFAVDGAVETTTTRYRGGDDITEGGTAGVSASVYLGLVDGLRIGVSWDYLLLSRATTRVAATGAAYATASSWGPGDPDAMLKWGATLVPWLRFDSYVVWSHALADARDPGFGLSGNHSTGGEAIGGGLSFATIDPSFEALAMVGGGHLFAARHLTGPFADTTVPSNWWAAVGEIRKHLGPNQTIGLRAQWDFARTTAYEPSRRNTVTWFVPGQLLVKALLQVRVEDRFVVGLAAYGRKATAVYKRVGADPWRAEEASGGGGITLSVTWQS